MILSAMRRDPELCDTAMGRAMLRACGVPVPHVRPRVGSIARVAELDGLAECFANHGTPMDGWSG